jgi:hypothetical protein
MIVLVISLAIALPTIVCAVVAAHPRKAAPVAPKAPVALATRAGLDRHGNAWCAVRTGPATARLDRNGCVYVEACGPLTLDALAGRYGITWER